MNIPQMQKAPGKETPVLKKTRMHDLKQDRNSGLKWLGFWIFASVFIVCDHYVFLQGYDSFFQKHKTSQEIELKQLKIEETKLRIELLKKAT
jgi:hypothetical protein